MKIGTKDYRPDELRQRVGNLAQLGGTRHVILNEGSSKGVAAIDVGTGAGLCFTVLPDRGLDISRASYKGINLAYLTPNGETHPAFYEPQGLGWLRSFFGGLLTTCGLTYLGPPGRDGEEELGLHGRYSNLPARQVQDRSRWDGETYRIEIDGTVEECVIFGDKLLLTRNITTQLGSRTITIHDRVENFGYQESPFTILYHINLGFPLLDASAELCATTKKTEPRDETAKTGLSEWSRFSAPVPGYSEQVFFHTVRPAQDGRACAALINRELAGGLGVQIRFDPKALPYLTQWKMMGQGDYVLGIEPGNVPVMNRAVLREKGLLPMLKPGEVREINVEIGVLEGRKEIDACLKTCGA